MALFSWTPSLSVGIELIDEQHKILIGLINQLHDAMLEKKSRDTLTTVFSELVKYTEYHFETEEKLFHQHDYPQTAQHLKEHKALTKRVFELKDEFGDQRYPITVDVLDFLQDWLVKHINGSDKSYAPFLKSKGL